MRGDHRLAASERDSVGLREGDFLMSPLQRDNVILTQTPQGYHRATLAAACMQALKVGGDANSLPNLLAGAGIPVKLVAGDPANIKITYAADYERLVASTAE